MASGEKKIKIVILGGKPLEGSPTDWESAKEALIKMNEGKDEHEQPNWSWDCGFKLDFDGPLIQVSSRFYPPAEYYGPNWDGRVQICFLGKTIEEKKFDCTTLDQLHKEVESFVETYVENLRKILKF